jgi:hypothetical protein
LPTQASLLKETIIDNVENYGKKSSWICKQRAGYGSHGNTVLTTNQAFELSSAMNENNSACTVLLQKMVEPPLLLNGRKFSLRVYVVLFGSTASDGTPAVYISREGLVKMAAIPFVQTEENEQKDNDEVTDDRIHMTNSGREAVMQQETFEFFTYASTGKYIALHARVELDEVIQVNIK